MSERQNLPRPAPAVTEDGVPAIEEIPEEVLLTGDPLEGELPPLDRPQAATGWGTTAAEQLAPEPLEVRLAREGPMSKRPTASSSLPLPTPGWRTASAPRRRSSGSSTSLRV